LPIAFKPERPGVSAAHWTTGTPPPLKAQDHPAAYIPARIDGRIRQCLLDSGAEVSLIPSQFVNSKRLTPDERRLFAANNTTISVDGQTRLPVVVNKLRFPATFLVSPNVDEVILGRDWLQENRVVWNFSENNVTVNGNQCKLIPKYSANTRCRRCRVGSDIEIPPTSEIIIPATVIYGHFRSSPDEGQWTTVPSEPIPGLRIARTLIESKSPIAAVRVCNVTQRPIRLHQGQSIGTLQNVFAVTEPQPLLSKNPAMKESLATMLSQVAPPSLLMLNAS